MIVLFMMFAHIGKEIIVFYVQCATLVKEIENTLIKGIKKVNDLCVVCECKLRNDTFKALLLKSIFFVNEDLLKVNLMYLFISVVYTELFEAIMLKHLETINIQKLYLPYFIFTCVIYIQSSIKLFNKPLKKAFIDGFCHWVSSLITLSFRQSTEHQLACNCSSVCH